MTFWEHFLRLLPHKPKQALAALYWHATRRRVRARNRLRVASADLEFPYRIWIKSIERNDRRRSDFNATLEAWTWRPRFSVILHAAGEYTTEQVDRSIKSVERQIYPAWVLQNDPGSAIGDAIARADGDYIVPLQIGDLLSESALFRFAEALQKNRTAAILYGDQDELDPHGRRRRPWFKPRWNEEMFLAQDYLSTAAAFERHRSHNVGRAATNLSELVLAVSSAGNEPIVHVPHVISHIASPADDHSQHLSAVREHLQHTGARCVPGPFGTVKVERPLPIELPLVSIIIPTRDKLELLRPCLNSLLQRTDYNNLEIMIIDNDSAEPRTREYFEEITKNPRVRILAFPGRYNFPAINNFAVRHARGAYLCLLNNDTEVIERAWLNEMLRYAIRPEVGAVGAKLLYDDGSIQHAGVVIGIGGGAGHAHRFLPAGQPGYFRQPHVTQFVSAVTAACLVIDKRKFLAVGGLDETELPVAFNDVDLCLKLQAAGWRNVYVPHAVLMHHESRSRGKDFLPKNINRYQRELAVLQERWGTRTYNDPLHNPNLDPHSETFVVRL